MATGEGTGGRREAPGSGEERAGGRTKDKEPRDHGAGRMETAGRGREERADETRPARPRPRCPPHPGRGRKEERLGARVPPSSEPQGQGGGAVLPSPSPSGSPHFSSFP